MLLGLLLIEGAGKTPRFIPEQRAFLWVGLLGSCPGYSFHLFDLISESIWRAEIMKHHSSLLPFFHGPLLSCISPTVSWQACYPTPNLGKHFLTS